MSPLLVAGPAEVPVLLYAHERPAVLVARAPAAATLRGGGAPRKLAPGAAVTFVAQGAAVLAAWPGGSARAPRWTVETGAPWRLDAGGNQRTGQGTLALTADRRGLLPVARIKLEPYIAGVVAAEMPGDWPLAAREAQAIAARTYTTARSTRADALHPGGAPLCDATHCQRWRGLGPGSYPARAAAQATAGQLLAWHGQAAEATWHAACGGWRADAADVFGHAAPAYLAGGHDRRPDGRPWHAAEPWTVDASAPALTRALRRAGWLRADETLTGLTVAEAAPGGHVRSLRMAGQPPRAIPGAAFWTAVGPTLGWRGLRSTAFTITSPAPGTWHFTGRGLGHGVGLCQAGARARAEAGQPADAILAAYFPGTTHARLVPSRGPGAWYHFRPEGERP